MPYELTLVIGRPYMITSNIDMSDGLANGSSQFIEYHNENSQPSDNTEDIVNIS